MASKETAQNLSELCGKLIGELSVYTEKGTKAAGKRARKLTLEFEKTAKIFRKESVRDSKSED